MRLRTTPLPKEQFAPGINECGILLATSPASWKFRGIPGDPSQRISVVLSFRYLGAPKKLTLYPPAHHREMVAKLYRNIGADHEYAAPGNAPELTGESEIRTGTNESEGCAEIFISRYGKDVVREVRRLCAASACSIMQPSTFSRSWGARNLSPDGGVREAGLFLRRILPRARIGDALILQFLTTLTLITTRSPHTRTPRRNSRLYSRARSQPGGLMDPKRPLQPRIVQPDAVTALFPEFGGTSFCEVNLDEEAMRWRARYRSNMRGANPLLDPQSARLSR